MFWRGLMSRYFEFLDIYELTAIPKLMNSNFEILNKLGFILGFVFSWATVLVYPPLHRILRNKIIFYTLFLIATFLCIISFLLYDSMITKVDKQMSIASLYSIIFLVLYKIYNNLVLNKNGRNIYFYIKYNSVWGDGESDEATGFENLLQFSLLFIPNISLLGINRNNCKINKKKPPNCFEGFRGIVRIRTGVGAFAEPSLATRPRRQLFIGVQIY
jgi:hypothetical protein